jgi:hypothetical protein
MNVVGDTLNYGPEYPYRDASFSFKQFRSHAPGVSRNRVFNGKATTCVDTIPTNLDFVFSLQVEVVGLSMSSCQP